MKKKDLKKIRCLTAAMKDAYRHPPLVKPDSTWRMEVMTEICSLAKRGVEIIDPFYVPRVLFRIVPLLAAASLVLFIGAWSSLGTLFNDLTVSAWTNLPFLGL